MKNHKQIMKEHKHSKKTIEVCGCNNCDNYAGGPKGIGALNLLRCQHCKEKHDLKVREEK